jgi:hypothetical protein
MIEGLFTQSALIPPPPLLYNHLTPVPPVSVSKGPFSLKKECSMAIIKFCEKKFAEKFNIILITFMFL